MSQVKTDSAEAGTETRPEEVVLAFYEAWDTVGFDEAYLTHLHPDVKVENPGLGVWEGKEKVMEMVRLYLRGFKRTFAKVDLHNMAINGNTVLTERTEHNRTPDGKDVYTGDLMSVFVIQDGQIIRWAEYYDPRPYMYGAAVPVQPLEWID